MSVDDSAMKLGLLLEGAHANQSLAEAALEKLKAQVSALEGIAREEIRATMLEELHALGEDCQRAGQMLRRLRYAADVRLALWTLGMASLACAVPLLMAWWLLPSRSEVAALGTQRDALAAQVARLEAQGARMELRRCGTAQRLCVRIDRKAGSYGTAGEYLVVQGY